MPGDTPMPFDADPFDPIKHPLREEALRWWDAGYARQATYSYGKRPPSPFADFFRGFVAGRDTLRRPVAESVDAALAALDVEPTHHTDRMVTTYDILGLDAVRAAHRAEVERAVAAEREACAALCPCPIGKQHWQGSCEQADAGEGDDADGFWNGYHSARNEVAAAIRARGGAK